MLSNCQKAVVNLSTKSSLPACIFSFRPAASSYQASPMRSIYMSMIRRNFSIKANQAKELRSSSLASNRTIPREMEQK